MKFWTVITTMAIILVSCTKETKECPGAVEKTFEISGFTKVNAGGTFTINIDKGNEFQVKANGCVNDLNDLKLTVANDGTLNVDFSRNRSDRYRVDLYITMPQLNAINLSGASKGLINGFNGQNAVISHILSGTAECTVNGAAINAHVDISGTAILNLNGYTENLYGVLSGASKLNAYPLTAYEVDIATSGTAKAYVKPDVHFYAEASGASRIYYKGNPQIKHVQTSGDGRVVQE